MRRKKGRKNQDCWASFCSNSSFFGPILLRDSRVVWKLVDPLCVFSRIHGIDVAETAVEDMKIDVERN